MITVAELLAREGVGGTVRGRIRGGAGAIDRSTTTLTDDTGSVDIVLRAGETLGFPEFNAVEIEAVLVPDDAGAPVRIEDMIPDIEAQRDAIASAGYSVDDILGQTRDSLTSEYLALRIAPLS